MAFKKPGRQIGGRMFAEISRQIGNANFRPMGAGKRPPDVLFRRRTTYPRRLLEQRRLIKITQHHERRNHSRLVSNVLQLFFQPCCELPVAQSQGCARQHPQCKLVVAVIHQCLLECGYGLIMAPQLLQRDAAQIRGLRQSRLQVESLFKAHQRFTGVANAQPAQPLI